MDSSISKTSRLSLNRMISTNNISLITDNKQMKNHQWINSDYDRLEFIESQLCLPMNRWRRLYLSGGIIIRHYTNDSVKRNLYRNQFEYLYTVFKEYLLRYQNQNNPNSNQGQQSTNQQQNYLKKLNQTSFLVQFHPYSTKNRASTTSDQWYPTYALTYAIQIPNTASKIGINDGQNDQNEPNDDNLIQISFRMITKQSFLLNTSDAFHKTVTDERMRRCLMIDSDDNDNNGKRIRIYPKQMPITDGGQAIQKRTFLIAKHGWLAVFVDKDNHLDINNNTRNNNHQIECYLLIENEYLLIDGRLNDIPIYYERILDTNQQSKQSIELFYRRTNLVQDKLSTNGMIVLRGCFQQQQPPPQSNDDNSSSTPPTINPPNSFTLIGLGNAMVNLSYLQQLLTISS